MIEQVPAEPKRLATSVSGGRDIPRSLAPPSRVTRSLALQSRAFLAGFPAQESQATLRIPLLSRILRTATLAGVLVAVVIGTSWRRCLADEPKAIDEQLLDQLIAEPIDEDVERELFGKDDVPPGAEADNAGEMPESPQGNQSLDKSLQRELGPAAVPEDANPLLQIAREMRAAERLLAEADSGSKTQDVQKRIVASLDELIRQARRQCSASAAAQAKSQAVASRQPVRQPQRQKEPSGAERRPDSQPVTDPNAAPGSSDPQRPSPEEMRGVLEELWGELPQTEREQMLELPVEELFLPKYEPLIEEYFRRLSEGQSPGTLGSGNRNW